MRRITGAVTFFGALMMFTVGTVLGADGEMSEERNARLCFDETVKVATGADPGSLSTFRCIKALRVDMLSRENRSAILHNLGIIQKAQGDLVAARTSFASAVRLSKTVDRRNLALAEVARELGDHRVAMEQYDLLTESDLVATSEDLYAAIFARRSDSDAAYFASIEESLACGACHGTNFISDDAEVPTLAGRREEYLEHALQQYTNGNGQNALMASQATLIADDDVAVLARYIASLDGPRTGSID